MLYDKKEINGDDYHKILLAIANLFELDEEVRSMTKTLYDPLLKKREE